MAPALEQHFEALPSKETYFLKQCIQFFRKKPNDESSVQRYYDQLVRLLVEIPYPALKTLSLIRESYGVEFLKQNAVVCKALKLLLSESEKELPVKFVSFIVNFPINSLDGNDALLQRLVEKLSKTSPSDQVYLALLGRSEAKLLQASLAHTEQNLDSIKDLPSKEFVLYQALRRKQHFAPIVSSQIANFHHVKEIALRNNLLILKLVNELSNPSQNASEIGNISQWLEAFTFRDVPNDLLEIHKFFYASFQRIRVILDFLKRFPDTYKNVKTYDVLKSSNILRLLLELGIKTNYEETRNLLDSSYKWQQQLSMKKGMRDLEMETLSYYSALSIVYDMVLADTDCISLDQYYTTKLQQLNGMLRQMRDINRLCTLIEDIFQLVFLRWEHLNVVKNTKFHGRGKSNKSSSYTTESSNDAGVDTPTTSFMAPPNTAGTHCGTTRHGFVCRGKCLHSLFTFLKNFVTKKLHTEDYKQSSEGLQLRFQRIIDIIGEALWKYSVLEKIDDSLMRASTYQQYSLEPEELLELVQMYVDPLEKCSSDDDDRCNYTSLSRRKAAKKRRRATFSGIIVPNKTTSVVTEQCRDNRPNPMMTSISVVQDRVDPVVQLKARNIMNRFTDRGIIPKMLGSPQNLAIMALALKNFHDVKYIIETFNLQNTDLNRELFFVEQQQQVKQKLATIYACYQRQEENSKNSKGPRATVEQIKNVAAKGFEVSKIISVIDNFAQSQKLQQSVELKQLLAKHSSNPEYAFLRQFTEGSLNAVIICDVILNLPFNREITSNTLMVIKRQQQITSGIAASSTDNSAGKMKFPRDMGPMPFLENLSECLRLMDDTKTLRELLSDNYYSLKPRKLAIELQREKAFEAVFYIPPADVFSSENLRSHAPLFQNLQSKCNYYTRFSAYVTQMTKLLRLRDRNIAYHTNEMLKIDPSHVIGELIFELNMAPTEIEANVAALNLNFVHVIALNMCPEIVGKPRRIERPTPAAKQAVIVNYVANHDKLLASLLQGIDSKASSFAGAKVKNPQYFDRFLNLPEIEELSALYEGNKFIAALHSDDLDMELVNGYGTRMDRLRILRLQMDSRASRSKRARIIDQLIVELIAEDPRNVHLTSQMHDVKLKAKLIQENFMKIGSTRLAKELIESTLQHRDAAAQIPRELRSQLEHTLADIKIYAKVSEVLQFETWPQVYDFGLKTPHMIFEKLLQLHTYKLCYEWCRVAKLSERFHQQKRLFMGALLDALLQQNDEPTDGSEGNIYLLRILETFSVEDRVTFFESHKEKFRSVPLLQYAIDFLSANRPASGPNDCYTNYKISLVIVGQLLPDDRNQYWHMLKYPLLIVEQLIMNTKFEILAKVLPAVRDRLTANEGSAQQLCSFCHDKRGHLYDIHTKTWNSPARGRLQGDTESPAGASSSAFILLNFNLYQKDHVITNECVDLLLRIYATKALDYQVSEMVSSSSELISQTTDFQLSLDSLCGTFEMPKSAPARSEWTRDEEASHCMCCRRAAFTMLMRRHHCRRCGRVVCFACSTHRMRIPELYEDVDVRICNDCHYNIEKAQRKPERDLPEIDDDQADNDATATAPSRKRKEPDYYKWKLSGNITHDKLLREEFCYEHAPSVALCLTILGFHLGQKKCIDLLLFHCRKLEKLIAPNPEVDYELVAKMMSCLALAAKVRGCPDEIETIREHSEIIMSVVQNGCEGLIPPGPLNNSNLRKLADSLVQAEKWQLALDVHLKCGFPTTGVMAAHGMSCLKTGCFETAREKFSHCMPKLSNELANAEIYKAVTSAYGSPNANGATISGDDYPQIKRPQRGPPLLQEIIKVIESIPIKKTQPETLYRASIIRNSNTSLASLISRRKDQQQQFIVPMQEPALNILNTLSNLRLIAKGQYDEGDGHGHGHPDGVGSTVTNRNAVDAIRQNARVFDECMHYVLTYGSHTDVLRFLMSHRDLIGSLKYVIIQNLDADLFIHNVFLVCLRCGHVPDLFARMLELDGRLVMWRSILLHTCRYLESQNLLHSLYQLQVLLKDPVRASMTCVKFYTANCDNFQQLHANAQHLHNAQQHLQSELEMSQWENINLESVGVVGRGRKASVASRRSSVASATSSRSSGGSFLMQMDARSLNSHINTILSQLDVAKFLAKCEKDNCETGGCHTLTVLAQIRGDSLKSELPTLFDSTQDKIQICILILLCGKNIEEGFGLAYRIIQDYKLPSVKVFAATARYMARNERLLEVEKLLNCIVSNNGVSTRDIDEIVSIAINSATNTHEPDVKAALDGLVKKIHSVELRISCHIFIGQLKSAYLLANKHERMADVRKILRQAELTNQVHIKKLCEKKLLMVSTMSPTQ